MAATDGQLSETEAIAAAAARLSLALEALDAAAAMTSPVSLSWPSVAAMASRPMRKLCAGRHLFSREAYVVSLETVNGAVL